MPLYKYFFFRFWGKRTHFLSVRVSHSQTASVHTKEWVRTNGRNDRDRGKLKYWKKIPSQCHFATNTTWACLGLNPCQSGGSQRLSVWTMTLPVANVALWCSTQVTGLVQFHSRLQQTAMERSTDKGWNIRYTPNFMENLQQCRATN